RFASIRDVITQIYHGIHTGLFLSGEGGIGKSFTVINHLNTLQEKHPDHPKYRFHNTRMTGRGLFDVLMVHPQSLHLIEDAETMMTDDKAISVLKSALWSQSTDKPMRRPITWNAFKTDLAFDFFGGIVVLSNQNLAFSSPDIRAIATRINVMQLSLTSDEIESQMRERCLRGYEFGDQAMTPAECTEVTEFVIALKLTKDFRIISNTWKDYIAWRAGLT